MDEQRTVMEQLNDFLRRRGLKANFLAEQLGMSISALYNFKSGGGFLTQRQLLKLRSFMAEYDSRLNGFLEEKNSLQGNGGKQNETRLS